MAYNNNIHVTVCSIQVIFFSQTIPCAVIGTFECGFKSNRKAMNRNWGNQRQIILIIIIIIMSLFYEDNIFSTITNLTYGPRLKKTNMTIITQYLQYIHKNIKVIMSEKPMPYLCKI